MEMNAVDDSIQRNTETNTKSAYFYPKCKTTEPFPELSCGHSTANTLSEQVYTMTNRKYQLSKSLIMRHCWLCPARESWG